MSRAPVVAMYSYKGGAGRTVASANVATLLAREFGKKVVLIDVDFESAGMSVVLGVHRLVVSDKLRRWALQDLLKKEVVFTGSDDFMKQYWPTLAFNMGSQFSVDEIDDRLWFIPSRPSHYDDVSDVGNKQVSNLYQVLNYIHQEIRPDIILLDSASGLAGPAVLSLELSHAIVVFMRWTEQFVDGTIAVIKWLQENRDSILDFFLVPSAVPDTLGVRDFEEQLSRQRDRVSLEFSDTDKTVNILNDVPESQKLKWKERIFNLEKHLSKEDEKVLDAYREIAQNLVGLCERESS